ncbi:conserved protein, unknown function [Hepatocystis sp. ex Piliocolobus tephrosceles]|nr:conserved protein, unknown function [Hepatocystis sp. ex Piliocolobus tephrosceles]
MYFNNSTNLNIHKMRKDLVNSVMKDEEYKKKDDKKKEIVKTCKGYKEFCDIVSSINMKPIKKYEEKITYEDYINLHTSISTLNSKSNKESVKKKTRNYWNSIATRQFSVNKQVFNDCSVKGGTSKNIKEINEFINVLNNNKDNYYNFIKHNYNSDDLMELINLIKNNLDLLLKNKLIIKDDDISYNDENRNKFIINNFIAFLFNLSKYWKEESLSKFFTPNELNDINSSMHVIIQYIEKVVTQNNDHSSNNMDNKLEDMLKYIKISIF